MKASRRRLKTIQLEPVDGHSSENYTETEEIFFFFLSLPDDFEAVKAHSEETARTSSLGVVSLCRRNLGSFK